MHHFRTTPVGNRLLASLSANDYALIEPMLERVPLEFHSVLIQANTPIEHVFFPESGVVSTLADIECERVEVGLIGREGFVGVPVVLGTDQALHTYVVQSAGKALRIDPQDLRGAIEAQPSIFKPLGLYTQSLIVQIAQTAYANATAGIEARVARWLLMTQDRVEHIEMPLTHEILAAMLGVRRPGITIATHVLEGMGAIRAKRGRIEIRDRNKLLELAGASYRRTQREHERLMAQI